MRFYVIGAIATLFLVFSVASSAAVDKSYYDVLGIPKTATAEEIKTSYRKLAMKLHPDRNPNLPRSEFQNLQEAYSTLSDVTKRSVYDQKLSSQSFRGNNSNTNYYSSNNVPPRPESQAYQKKPFDDRYQEPPKQPRPEQSAPPPVSKAPAGWFQNVRKEWNERLTTEANLLAAVLGSNKDDRDYILFQMKDWDWKNPKVQHALEHHLRPHLRSFAHFIPQKYDDTKFKYRASFIKSIFDLPIAIHFADMIPTLIEAVASTFVIEEILTNSKWYQHPDFSDWIKKIILTGQKRNIESLFTKLYPTLPAQIKNNISVQSIVATLSPTSPLLNILARSIPLSSNGYDYTAEFESIANHGDNGTRGIIARRLDAFFRTGLSAVPPEGYYAMASKLAPYLNSRETSTIDPHHPANNQTRNFKSEAPENWHKYNKMRWSDSSELENLITGLLTGNESTREYNLIAVSGIDWKTKGSLGNLEFARLSENFLTNFRRSDVPDQYQRTAAVENLFALPMTVHFPQLLKQFDHVPFQYSSEKKHELPVLAISIMAQHLHWLESAELETWIEGFIQLKSTSVNAALENLLLPQLKGSNREKVDRLLKPVRAAVGKCSHLFL